MARAKIVIERRQLESLYIKLNLSPYKIGVMFGCSFATVTNRLKDYKIPLKNQSLSRQKYPKYDFSGDDSEKAYLLGFRIGDLNVYQTSDKSDFIVARCHTTTQEQVNLMDDLFSRYGRITKSPSQHGSFHINCYLNKTFDFLLGKNCHLEQFNTKLTVFSFVAGYIDAEGYFGLSQGRARLKIDSYDTEVLSWIHNQLINSGIRSILKVISVCRDSRNFGKKLYRINVNKAESLEILFAELKKYLRHQTRITQVETCENNLAARKIKHAQ